MLPDPALSCSVCQSYASESSREPSNQDQENGERLDGMLGTNKTLTTNAQCMSYGKRVGGRRHKPFLNSQPSLIFDVLEHHRCFCKAIASKNLHLRSLPCK
mmetsp:Transcript_26498/g.43465  ORF Transcript_26498/g.43465 Transcript_26498/m.43465 type:complete len:101 (-) Transcript_26498:127-429(-)